MTEVVESANVVLIEEQQANNVKIQEDGACKVLIDETTNNITLIEQTSNVLVEEAPQNNVLISEQSNSITILEGGPLIQSISDLVVGNPVIGSMIEYDGTQWVTTMADFETHFDVNSGDSTINYLGKAAPGSADNAAVWQIQRIRFIGDAIHIDWANGSNAFDQIWDDRESLTYS